MINIEMSRPVSPEEKKIIMDTILLPLLDADIMFDREVTTPAVIRKIRNALDKYDPSNEATIEAINIVFYDDLMLPYQSIQGKTSGQIQDMINAILKQGADAYNAHKRREHAVQVQQMIATTPGLNKIPANVGPTIAHFVSGAYVPPTGGSMKKKRRGAKKTRRMKRRGRKTLRK